MELQHWEQSLAERRRAEERIRRLNAVLRATRNVNQLITREKDRDRLLKGACENLIRTQGYHNAWIALLDGSGGLVTTAEAGLGENFSPLVKRLERGEMPYCAQMALAHPDVLVIEDTLSTCAGCPLSAGYSGRKSMTVRLEHGGKVYGLLSVLYEETQQSEEKYRSLVNTTNDLIFTVDAEGNILFANPSAKAFTSYEPEETIGHHFSEYMHPDDVPILLAGVQQVLSGEPLESIRGVGQAIEYRMTRRDGQIVWVQTRAWPIRDAQGKSAPSTWRPANWRPTKRTTSGC